MSKSMSENMRKHIEALEHDRKEAEKCIEVLKERLIKWECEKTRLEQEIRVFKSRG